MNKKSPFILVYICLVFHTGIFAYYKQYTISNGLLSNIVYHAYQDSRGYMWFSTDRGIIRYDGKFFKNYTILDGLADNEVFNFFEDRLHRIWLSTYNGNYCYIHNDSIYSASNDTALRKIPPISFLISLYNPDDSTIYMGYANGRAIKVQNSRVTPIITADFTSPFKVSAIYKEGDFLKAIEINHNIFIANDSIVRIDSVERQYSYIYGKKMVLVRNYRTEVYENNKLITTYFNNAISPLTVISVFIDDANNVFCSTIRGLVVFNRFFPQGLRLFPDVTVTSVYQDMGGNYWVTTLGNGMYCLYKDFQDIKFITNVNNAKTDYTRAKQFFVILQDSLYLLSGDTIKNLHFSIPNKCHPLYAGENILLYSSDTTYLHVPGRREKRLTDYTKYVYPYGNNNYLIVSIHFVYNCKIANGNPVFIDSLFSKEPIHLPCFDDSDEVFYFSKANAVYRYDVNTHKQEKLISLKESLTNMIYVNNRLVMFTNNNTCYVYDNKRTTTLKFSIGNILIYELYSLSKNDYLIRTDKGYYLLTIDDQFLIRTTRKIESPFKAEDVYYMYPYKDKILCNVNGNLCLFKKELLYNRPEHPAILINNVSVNGIAYAGMSSITTNAHRCNVNIDVGSFSFVNSDNAFQYRIIRGSEVGAWYTSLSGNINILLSGFDVYHIQLRTITSNNIVSETKTIEVALTPPFYLTTSFIIILILVFIALCIWAVFLFVRKRKIKFQNELHYMQLEHKAINSLLNPHFIFNAINNIQNLVNKDERESANNYLAMLSKLIRQNIENLKYDLIPLDKELTLISNYIRLQNLRYNNNIRLILQNNVQHNDISIPPLLIHTFVENAIVHGFRKDMTDFAITIDLSISTDNYLVISIVDNGVGYNPVSQSNSNTDKTSMGIEFTRKRLQRLSDFYHVIHSLQIQNLQEKDSYGTEVIIVLYSKFAELIPAG